MYLLIGFDNFILHQNKIILQKKIDTNIYSYRSLYFLEGVAFAVQSDFESQLISNFLSLNENVRIIVYFILPFFLIYGNKYV